MQDFLYDLIEPKDELCHYGILGQKWGERRYQNKDGSLTEAGKKRYLNSDGTLNKVGAKRLKKRDDGTYYDVTKYSRKLGLVGAAIDLSRLAKENKTRNSSMSTKTTKRPESTTDEYNKVSDAFKKSGWKVDDSGDFGGDIYATKPSKLGSHKITISTLTDPGDTAGYIGEHMKKVNSNVSKLESNGDKIYKQSIEHIAKDLYDNNVGDVQSKMSRSEFKSGLKAESAHVSDWDSAELGFYHPTYGEHSLYFDYDLKNLKPVDRGVSMDG